MKNPLSTFADSAKSLSQNPLGIIALFLVLVYGIAALVFGFSGVQLESDQKWPMIWFLVFFPILVLILFGWLVAFHHTKLYSPKDYQDEEGFFRALSPLEQKQKLEEEVNSITEEFTSSQKENEAKLPTNKQITDRLYNDTRSQVMIAEELVFRELEAEYGHTIQRNVGIGGSPDFGIDGLIFGRRQVTAIEVKFSRGSRLRQMFRNALRQVEHLVQRLPQGTGFIIALVTEGLSNEQREQEKTSIFELLEKYKIEKERDKVKHPIEVRLYDFDELKSKYGLTKEA